MVRLALVAALCAILGGAAASASGRSSPATPFCSTADVRVTLVMAQGAAGSGRADFRVRNVSGRACHTFGYPGIALYDGHGHRNTLHIARSTHALGGTIRRHHITLVAGAVARFVLSYVEISNRPGPCTLVRSALVIMPDDRHAQRVGLSTAIAPCSDLRVSPLTR